MDSFQPIVGRRAYQSGLFAHIPVPMENRAIILSSSATKRMQVLDSTHYVTVQKIRREKYDEEIEIDTQSKRLNLELKATCQDKYHDFVVLFGTEAVVINPLVYFQSGTADVASILMDRISDFIYAYAGKFEIGDYLDFANCLLKEYQGKSYTDITGIKWQIVAVKAYPDERAKINFGKQANINVQTQIKLSEIDGAKKLDMAIQDNDAVAAYAGILAGDDSLAEAYIKRVNLYAQTNNIKVEEIKRAIDIISLMKEKDLVTGTKANEMTMKLLGTLPNINLNSIGAGENAQQAALQSGPSPNQETPNETKDSSAEAK